MVDYPDGTLPISITAYSITSLPIDIIGQTVGNITIDIVAQTVGDIDVNITNATITVTGTVSISGTVTVSGSVTVSGTVSISGTVTVSGSVTVSGTVSISGTVTITGSVTVSGSVSITGTVTITGAVTITSGTIDIQTTGDINILIDLLDQDAYTARVAVIQNDAGAIDTQLAPTGTDREGKFFPRGMRGHINQIEFYTATISGTHNINVYVSPYIGAGYIHTGTISISGVWGWQALAINKMWEYDSMFIWWYVDHSDIVVAADDVAAAISDHFSSSDSGVTWAGYNYNASIRVTMKGLTIGDVPVSGTVNTVKLPNVGGQFSGSVVTANDGVEKSLHIEYGMGTVLIAEAVFTTVVAPTNTIVYQLHVYVDGVIAFTFNNRDASRSNTATSGECAIGQFYQNDVQTFLQTWMPIEFMHKLEIRVTQNSGGNRQTQGLLTLNKIK